MSQLIFDKYEVVRRLALGGMGEVFLARQTGVAGFDRLVILKSLLPELAEQEGFVDQFLDEARVAATLNHPNIVAIYEVGLWNGVYFIAMEYIHGEDLARLALVAKRHGESIPVHVVTRIMHDASLGLHHAHSATDLSGKPLNIVHRDISPQNVMVRSDGVTKVVDFGIAKAANRSTRTATGLLKGKLQYMPPEQVHGQEVDQRADQWALGVILWELTCGQRLFKGNNEVETLRRVLEDPIPSPSSIVAGYPPQLEAVVMRMLRRDPSQRYPTCEVVANELKLFLDACTAEVGESTVASYVQNRMGQELDERTRNLTPATGTNFLIQLSHSTDIAVSQPNIDGQWLPARTNDPSSKWLLAAAVGILPVLLLCGVALWLMGAPDSAAPNTDSTNVAASGPSAPVAVSEEVPPEGASPAPPPKKPALLVLESEPAGSSVWVGGRLLGETPMEIDALPAGETHELLLTKQGHREHKFSVTLEPGQNSVHKIVLEKQRSAQRSGPGKRNSSKPQQETGAAVGFSHLTLNTKPWAKVDIDGEPHGITPIHKVKLKPGKHTLRLVNESKGINLVRYINLAPGQHLKRTLTLN